jgi:pimeloyl-ACP methyl ester carboxylesterase
MNGRNSTASPAACIALCPILVSCGGGGGGGGGTATGPMASVKSHANEQVVKASPIVVSGTLTGAGATVTVAGVAASVAGNSFSASVPLAEGKNSLQVVASANGQTSRTSLNVVLNTTEMCGSGETFTVQLPGVRMPEDPSTDDLPDRRLPNDSVTLPKGCKIYAFMIHGYGRNGNLDELMFYKLAKFVAENDGYAHWSWWNNFLAEYMARPLHSHSTALPSPGDLLTDSLAFVIPEGRGKGIPDDDYQFQSDAGRVLEAVRAENPDAIIVVAGHSMGGNATARLGFNTNVNIDLLAPIDPVGNRNLPDGVGGAIEYQLGLRSPTPGVLGYRPGNETYNWTRWRATREFRGYKQRDCVRNSIGLCRDFDDRLFHTEYRCRNLPEVGWLEHPPFILTFAPFKCPRALIEGPVRDSGIPINFRTNIKRLYHRWQQETFFPYDFHADDPDHKILGQPSPIRANYRFGSSANRSRSIFGANYQAPVPENAAGESDPDRTCDDNNLSDPRGAVSFGGDALACRNWDGHGEIIGMRALTGVSILPTNGNLQPLALKAQPFASASDSWLDVSQSAERRARLIGMATAFDPATGADTWPHRPVNPDLDMVVDDLVLIVQDIIARGEPGGPDVTPPSSSATLDIEANQHGWNNTDVIVTIAALDEQGGSGIKEITFSYSGAESGNGVVEGDSLQIMLSDEGETVIEYYATDNAGNQEETNTLTVRIDKTPPLITAVVEPEPNANGWNNTDVTVTFVATDGLSGIDTVTDPITVTDEGADQEVVGEAIDLAGNSSTVGVILNIDKTPPVISGLPENCSLWAPNHKLVEVATIVASDALSGLDELAVDATSSEPASGPGYGNAEPDVVITDGVVQLRAERYSHEGRQYLLNTVATDLAGNVAEGDAVCIVLHDQGNSP